MTFEDRKLTNWNDRASAFEELLAKHKRKGSKYDCVLAWSGGKDSSAIALKLKYEYGLNPLLVTFAQLIPTGAGIQNRQKIIDLGFDAVYVEPPKRVSGYLSQRFFRENGDPKLHWNAGVNSAPVRLAVENNVSLVFFAENGEAEYGGRVLSEDHLMRRDFQEMLKNSVGQDPVDWVDNQISKIDILPYTYPNAAVSKLAAMDIVYYAYFFPWDGESNLNYVQKYVDFQSSDRGRNYGAYGGVNGVDDKIEDLYYYMQFIKFGFGRAFKDACRDIQRGKITREEAIDLIDAHDGEFPEDNIGISADYMSISRTELVNIIDKHRNANIWASNAEGTWSHRYDVPKLLAEMVKANRN
jgi:N-acetyl sugar amidotransferase